MSDEKDSIRELIESWASTTWAAALFAFSQAGRILSATDSQRTASSFDSVTSAVELQFGEGIRMIFQTMDQLQRGWTDAMFGALTSNADVTRLTVKTAFDLAGRAAGTVAVLTPERESRIAWLEFQNKLETFNLFAHVDLAAELPQRLDVSLAELVERASCLGPYRSVWAMEGVGHFYAELCGSIGAVADLKGQSGSLPASSLVALHAGAGLSFANRCLSAISSRSAVVEVRTALERFETMCNENSHEAYVGATYEALGLAARSLHPHLLAEIDRHLTEMDEELVGYFWHGVGRGIYFAPTNFLPDTGELWRALKQAQQEPPHELARLNAMSGLLWALVLVNIRHPEVIEVFLRDNAEELKAGETLANGLCSALVIWRASSPDGEILRGLCRHRPTDTRMAALWEEWVSRPGSEVVRRYHPVLTAGGCLGRVFRHQSLSELVASLEAAALNERGAAQS